MLLVGCRQPGGERPEIEQVRPPLREFSVLLEGMPETLSARLWQAPTSFPLQFSTYVPADMTVSVSEVGASLELIAAFGGVRSERARVEISVLSESARPEEVVEDLAWTFGGLEAPARHAWAEREYVFVGNYLGWLALAEHEGRWFYILVRYPPEYADGMAPRVALVLEQWRWRDGEPLGLRDEEE